VLKDTFDNMTGGLRWVSGHGDESTSVDAVGNLIAWKRLRAGWDVVAGSVIPVTWDGNTVYAVFGSCSLHIAKYEFWDGGNPRGSNPFTFLDVMEVWDMT
jgi:hypothetical protein